MKPPDLSDIATLDLHTLMSLAERIAVQHCNGHFTLMRFTTGWKCVLGTPDTNILDRIAGRCELQALPKFQSLREALADFVCCKR